MRRYLCVASILFVAVLLVVRWEFEDGPIQLRDSNNLKDRTVAARRRHHAHGVARRSEYRRAGSKCAHVGKHQQPKELSVTAVKLDLKDFIYWLQNSLGRTVEYEYPPSWGQSWIIVADTRSEYACLEDWARDMLAINFYEFSRTNRGYDVRRKQTSIPLVIR